MRIALFTDAFFPYISGVVTAVAAIAKGMADRGHKVFIIAPDYRGKEVFKHKNIKVIRCRSFSASKMYKDFRIAFPISPVVLKTIVKEKIQVIHFHSPATLGLEAMWIARLLRLPLIGTFHTFIADPDYLQYLKLNSRLGHRIAWDFSNFSYNRCDLITSPSLQTKKEMMRNRCSRPVKVISNGIDFSMFNNSKASLIKKKYNPDGKLLLFVGRMGIEKNLYYLLDCFKLVLNKVPSTKLLMVGDGPIIQQLKDYSSSLGIKDKVIFTGTINHTELVESGIFGAVHGFVSASLTENQPITVLEAQANGIVCVVINAKGMPDLVIDNVNGFLAPKNNKRAFADAVVKLLEDERLYARLRKGTLREIQKHKLSHVIDEWEKTYSELIQKCENRRKHSRKRILDLIRHRIITR